MTRIAADNQGLFQRLKADEEAAWTAFVNHPLVVAMGAGKGARPKPAFQRSLQQDYLFLIHFARAYVRLRQRVGAACLIERAFWQMRFRLAGLS